MELGTETFYQLVGMISLLLLAESDTPTVSGLETMFEKNDSFGIPATTLLAISICLSLKTCFLVYVKAIHVQKSYFPFTARLAVLLFAVLGAVQRVGTMVAFFIPFLGHFSILSHWKAEQTPWASRNLTYHEAGQFRVRQVDYSTDVLYLAGGVSVPWSELNRADYADPRQPLPPSYTLYTGISLGQAFGCFWLINGLNIASLIIVKLFTVPRLADRKNNLEIFIHAVENSNLACLAYDWDWEGGSVAEHKMRCRQVTKEMFLTLTTNLLWSFSLLIPVFYTGSMIMSRHSLLARTVGTLEQEEAALITAVSLMILLPVCILITFLGQLGLYLLYNYRLHPWKEIVQDVPIFKTKKEKQSRMSIIVS